MSLATQASLSNFGAGGAAAREVVTEVEAAFGAPKNEVMELLALGFFASAAARSTALRLSEAIAGLRKARKEDRLGSVYWLLLKIAECYCVYI